MSNKTAVAISGGIDSLTAAFLLKKQKKDIFGIHFLTGYEKNKINIRYIEDILKIKVHTINIKEEFDKKIVFYFIKEYKKGKTPNPCLVCNPKIKFGVILNNAKKFGASCIATGHYARVEKNLNNKCRLFAGKDKAKDQSYFLAFLKQTQLQAAVFPLAGYTKEEVKKIAEKNRLILKAEKESQDICFIKNKKYSEFLNITQKTGEICNNCGEIIGKHNGLHLFTIGQRKGINIPAQKPYYVLKIDPKNNRLTVGYKENLLSNRCFVKQINIINCPDNNNPFNIKAKIRYRHTPAKGILYLTEDKKSGKIIFACPQSAVTPGQGAVFYDADEVIGAGIIE
ncbi:MAG: tRNA 2-thiouridine(34) synthase MnmA [Deltaproteobacteria bacterium]|nr:tRNA 2-thiouridine(34) synthase MnmA [Deltaproteobacteria bacterium]